MLLVLTLPLLVAAFWTKFSIPAQIPVCSMSSTRKTSHKAHPTLNQLPSKYWNEISLAESGEDFEKDKSKHELNPKLDSKTRIYLFIFQEYCLIMLYSLGLEWLKEEDGQYQFTKKIVLYWGERHDCCLYSNTGETRINNGFLKFTATKYTWIQYLKAFWLQFLSFSHSLQVARNSTSQTFKSNIDYSSQKEIWVRNTHCNKE